MFNLSIKSPGRKYYLRNSFGRKDYLFFWLWSKRLPEIFFLDENDTWSFFLDEKDTSDLSYKMESPTALPGERLFNLAEIPLYREQYENKMNVLLMV